ncbi:Cellular nucleic acid-binding protein-like protein [Bienertia sinuspersici]
MRLKVTIKIDKPLRRGLKIAMNQNSSKWVDIKYERLGDFCYYLGRLGHVDRDCNVMQVAQDEVKEVVYKYGP